MSRPTRHVVLIGAGHAHVQVLARWALARPAGMRLTLIVDDPVGIYSGMVPGMVEGRYQPVDLEIDAVPLARRAGARIVLARAVGLDPVARQVKIEGRPPIGYDFASLDIGCGSSSAQIPGVADHAVATRPIARIGEMLSAFDQGCQVPGRRFEVVVVGGGAAGVELTGTLASRSVRRGWEPAARLSLLEAGPRILADRTPRLAARVLEAFERRGISVECGRRVVNATKETIECDDGSIRPCDLLVWAAGAVPPEGFDAAALPRDPHGFILIEDTLQVSGHPGLFAVGDCSSLRSAPWVAKAGVYAVRAAGTLADNLEACLEARALRPWYPQRQFLVLLNLGEGEAAGERSGIVVGGRWVLRVKDWIDRRFVERFRYLNRDDDVPSAAVTSMPMVCGGCAAKLGPAALERVVAGLGVVTRHDVVLGLADADDVVAWRTPSGDTVVGNVELLRAFCDDPYLVGRVAAINALSDLDAKGVAPRVAQAIVAVPLDLSEPEGEELVAELLSGARAVFEARDVILLGGHTARAAELLVGFAVEGIATQPLWPRRGLLEPGDWLILTRPLGTGVLLHADMAGRARGRWVQALGKALIAGNAAAAAELRSFACRAATDVTGFGLIGHVVAMLPATGLQLRLDLERLPALPGARELLRQGERSSFHHQNEALMAEVSSAAGFEVDPSSLALAFDPQTAGGLVVILAAEHVETALAGLRAAGSSEVAVVGRIEKQAQEHTRIVLGPLGG